LILEKDLKFNFQENRVSPVCLPDQSNVIPENHKCKIVGFGFTSFEGKKSDQLRHAEMQLVPVETCNKPESFNNTIQRNTSICGGDGSDVSPCNYDSGGGLVCQKNGEYNIQIIMKTLKEETI